VEQQLLHLCLTEFVIYHMGYSTIPERLGAINKAKTSELLEALA
jgi:hypothetical protein